MFKELCICKNKNKSTFSPQLEYISISCNHSNYDYCYSFTAYTKDSKAYFSADCTIENFELSGKHIEFENKKKYKRTSQLSKVVKGKELIVNIIVLASAVQRFKEANKRNKKPLALFSRREKKIKKDRQAVIKNIHNQQ